MNQRELYQALNASDENDLLRHFPSRYEDLTPTIIPYEPADSQRIVVKGRVEKLRSLSPGGRSIIRFTLRSMTGISISCMLYNQSFYLSKLSAGKDLLLVAYYSLARKVYMVQSIFDLDSYYALTGIRPVYTLPKTVSSSYFTNVIKKILSMPSYGKHVVSPLPTRLIEKYRLLNEFDAFRQVHLPRNQKDLKEGLRVFQYEEALSYCVRAASLKREARKEKRGKVEISHQKINDFVRSLSYKLTKDQLTSIREIVTDLESDYPMYRLLQGDVGTGKTIVAFTALYANFLKGRQGVLMAPTFELSKQHYQNALKVLTPFNMKIAFLGGDRKAKERREILAGLQDGTIDVLIGTKAAVSDDVLYSNLGLSIIDEQQRFGVLEREQLVRKGKGCDLLMMSATPIPRTLSQIINMDLEVSSLTEFPHGQRDVKTSVVTPSDPVIYKAIDKALAAKRQIFIVAPKIEKGTRMSSSATEVFEEIKARYGEENCQLLHGKIKKEEQDHIIERFVSGEKMILVSTTVIEVGIDVSKAALLIVYDANYFGLSSLHQLRGRIGRSGEFALCLLVYDGDDVEAKEKLEVLANTNDGFKISEFDLKQRGGGSYGGSSQSGKSEFRVCNFATEQKMFLCAKEDAEEILSHPEEEENARYLKTLNAEKDLFLS